MAEYFSYLLRIWNQKSGTNQEWRATLESTATHRVFCFNSMKSLTVFLSGNQEEDCGLENSGEYERSNQACAENPGLGEWRGIEEDSV